jgi:hypothetical protein
MRTILIIVIVLVVFAGLFGVIYYIETRNQLPPDLPDFKEQLENDCLKLGCSEDTIYVGSINSDKYYECRCGWAQNINPENLACFSSDAEALADNRVKSEC